MSVAVTLSIPDLLNPLRIKEASSSLDNLKLPALQTLLSKGDAFPAKVQNAYEVVSYLFHQPKVSAYASVMAAAELASYDKSIYWLRVDPVQMIADRDSLVLIPGEDIAITEVESKALLEAFNEYFEQDKVCLEYGSATHWYLRMAYPVDIKTHSLQSVAYKPVGECYPAGNAAVYWRKMMNEAQMLFFSHPVNDVRREAGLPEINSIWIWGEGQLKNTDIVTRPNAMIWSDDLYLKGLARLADSQLSCSPENYQIWIDAVSSGKAKDKLAISHHLIQLDPISNALDYMQQSEWLVALEQLERQWLKPLMQALKHREIDSLLLDFGSGFRYHLKPQHLKRFWRLKKSLMTV